MDDQRDSPDPNAPATAAPPAKPGYRHSRLDTVMQVSTILGWSVLVALVGLLSGVNRGREKSRRVQCAGNLKQIGLALLTYSGENSGYFPLTPSGTNFEPLYAGQYLNDGKVYGCPSAEFLATSARQANYVYLGSGVKDDDPAATQRVVAFCPPDNHPAGAWMDALFVDGHVEGAFPDGSKTWNDPDYLLAQARLPGPTPHLVRRGLPTWSMNAVLCAGLGLILAALSIAAWLAWPRRKAGGP